MKITFAMVSEHLRVFNPLIDATAENGGLWFTSVALLPKAPPDAPPPNTLYLAPLKRLNKQLVIPGEGCALIVVDESSRRPAGPADCPPAAMVIRHGDLAEVFGHIQDLFSSMARWEAEMELALARRSGLQAMMDLSEPYFTNPIFIVNRSLKLAACTRNIPIRHPALVELSRTGNFPKEMVASISRRKYLNKSESFTEIGYHHPPNYINCTIIIKAFAPNPLRLNTISLYGLNSQPTEADLARLSFLAEGIIRHAAAAAPDSVTAEPRDTHILIDILDGGAGRAELEKKTSLLSLPLEADYRLYCLWFEDYTASSRNFVAEELRRKMPFASVFPYRSNVLALVRESGEETAESRVAQRLAGTLKTHRSCCGVSFHFTDLTGLREAARSAEAALEIGRCLNPGLRCYSFDDYFIYQLLVCGARELGWRYLYDQRLDVIRQEDLSKRADNLRLLRIYLTRDRSISETAEAMRLHRNTVVYRIRRIEETLGISLDDPDTRLRLLMSFKALEISGFFQPGRPGSAA